MMFLTFFSVYNCYLEFSNENKKTLYKNFLLLIFYLLFCECGPVNIGLGGHSTDYYYIIFIQQNKVFRFIMITVNIQPFSVKPS